MRDAPFSLFSSVPFMMGTTPFAGRPGARIFDDARGYYPGAELVNRGPAYAPTDRKWVTVQTDASVVLPATKPYALKAPGYGANDEFRFDCVPLLSGVNAGRLSCYWLGTATGLGYAGGTGNPGDTGAQYGWHVEILEQTDEGATVRIWNSK